MKNNTSPISCNLKIKVVPRASKPGISGWLGDALKVRVAEPPEKGKANKAVEKTIAQALNLPAQSVKVIMGLTSSRKVVEITGLSSTDLQKRLM